MSRRNENDETGTNGGWPSREAAFAHYVNTLAGNPSSVQSFRVALSFLRFIGRSVADVEIDACALRDAASIQTEFSEAASVQARDVAARRLALLKSLHPVILSHVAELGVEAILHSGSIAQPGCAVAPHAHQPGFYTKDEL